MTDSQASADLESHLASELRRVIDEAAVRDLASRYCWAIDRLDRAAFDTVFLPDATAVLGQGEERGIEEIWAKVDLVLSPLTCSQHLVGSHVVEVDGDTATHRCQFHAQHVMKGCEGGDQYIVAGTYEDRVERTAAGWRIRHRDLTVLWTSGNPLVARR
ncbi:MAG: nuclear transport factor 2 family protein [Actinobacteria bacterium]|nr:nuclear transport factor 2 family protein [Actinomycetota bacterium]